MDHPVLALVNVETTCSPAELFPNVSSSAIQGSACPEILLHMRCKYYRADVIVREIHERSQLKGAEAVVICFDGRKASSWDSSCNWMQAANELNLPLRLLVCGTLVPANLCTNVQADMTSYHRFAIEREFELIELQPEEDSIEEGEEFGVHRLKSALEAHMWPNMELLVAVNPRRQITTDVMTSTGVNMLDDKPASGTNESSISNSKSPSSSPATEKEEDKESDAELGLDETAESFERLCLRLLKTRDQMSGLGFEERKKLAEKVTMEFWKVVGGSDDELTGEDSDDDHLSA
ncbi:Alpha- and gamma-adaptin-binding protein p34 [Clonorchis sinensis]|uniref:Alpha- and gamma-adaptin-binding protein p34 n=1 Tax=Clonorchis sinensis TaxID=79923 RepID=A0A8T1MVC4_CLOSI|nr:Alpha- and gamma-adaptin-binding protein p34 [Clonorchis sinensis]